MRALLAAFAATATIAGCLPAQRAVPVGPGFYPAAIAHDAARGALLVASFATGRVVAIDPDGRTVATLRQGQPDRPVLRIAFDPVRRMLWSLLPDAVEIHDAAGARTRHVALPGGTGARLADLALDGDGAYLLDAAGGRLLRIDARGVARLVAAIPSSTESAAAGATARGDAPWLPGQEGAIAVLGTRGAVLVALDGKLWQVARMDGAIVEVALGRPLSHVSQLIAVADAEDGVRLVALRASQNEIAALWLSPDGRRAEVDDRSRMALDMPLGAAFDGRAVHVLLSPMRHHPSLGGDGRPNVPGRIARIEPEALGDGRVHVARARGE